MNFRTSEDLLAMMRGFQAPAVLGAAAELGLLAALARAPMSSEAAADALGADPRGTTVLLDALAALGVARKEAGIYALPPELRPWLAEDSPSNVLPMLCHQANCLRRWARLAWTVREGRPSDAGPSIRGPAGDLESFIQAMNVVSGPVADLVVGEADPGGWRHLLDVGGASGTWTLAWLRRAPEARATIFDLPDVVPMARERIAAAGMGGRVDVAPGDYLRDPLPAGADLAWISAIIHQHSRGENRGLYRRVAAALVPGGRVLIRDIVMDDAHTAPVSGALFAVNMLAGTAGGGTYALSETRADLESAGFRDVRLVRADEGMHAVICAVRP